MIADQMKTISGTFPKLTFKEQRLLVEELLDSIKVSKDGIDISLYLLPDFQKNLGLSKNIDEPMRVRCVFNHEIVRDHYN